MLHYSNVHKLSRAGTAIIKLEAAFLPVCGLMSILFFFFLNNTNPNISSTVADRMWLLLFGSNLSLTVSQGQTEWSRFYKPPCITTKTTRLNACHFDSLHTHLVTSCTLTWSKKRLGLGMGLTRGAAKRAFGWPQELLWGLVRSEGNFECSLVRE